MSWYYQNLQALTGDPFRPVSNRHLVSASLTDVFLQQGAVTILPTLTKKRNVYYRIGVVLQSDQSLGRGKTSVAMSIVI